METLITVAIRATIAISQAIRNIRVIMADFETLLLTCMWRC